ncbi:acid protease [Clavulina sp. PMI_390]|nr:acid protease [Clavulina sp. PMI_390]
MLHLFLLFPAVCLWAIQAHAANVSVAVGASDSTIGLSPYGSWFEVGAPGEFSGGARFLLSNANLGVITYVFSTPSTTFEFWGYQRSDGALYNISFDGVAAGQIDAYNATSTGSDGPRRLYLKTGLTNAVHSVRIVNVFDSRGSKYGQMNIDHIVITGNPPDLIHAVAPTFPANGFLAEGKLEYSYHAFLSLGAEATVNGGNGSTVDVLLDAGASESWVVWTGCDDCGGHQNYYKESTQHFSNSSVESSIAYGSGGEANTLDFWKVNDTLAFSNITILSTTLGASYHIPTGGEGLDGNFGIAKSYCAGAQCAAWPSFVEAMYQDGIIKSPVIAFYQLNSTDQPASGVTSKVDVGGLDRNKYLGTMDWIPVTQDSMWNNPSSQRFVKGSGNWVNATAQFTHTSIVFDTGDPGILGIPTNDWDTLLTLVGAETVNGATLFPCSSEITFNFRGTQFRNYTYSLVDTTTNNGNGFCTPTANDAGSTTNWITGVPFLDNYYIAFYFGNAGINSTMGFAPKNLAASAATAQVVVGSA